MSQGKLRQGSWGRPLPWWDSWSLYGLGACTCWGVLGGLAECLDPAHICTKGKTWSWMVPPTLERLSAFLSYLAKAPGYRSGYPSLTASLPFKLGFSPCPRVGSMCWVPLPPCPYAFCAVPLLARPSVRLQEELFCVQV